MNRQFDYTISEDISYSIESFLKSKGFSATNLKTLKKTPNCILVNALPQYMNYQLKCGDHLSVCLQENSISLHIPPIKLPLSIVYEDEDLLVVDKQPGMPIHPSLHNYENSLANALAYYFQEKNCPFVFRCINRLDRDTSGLTIIAKHSVSAAILGNMVAEKKQLTREYLAIVRGTPTPQVGQINAPIGRRDGSIIERVVDFAQGESAITHYEVLKTQNGHSLVSLVLETGRTHQIRVHMKYIGYPLIGDYLYNPDTEWMSRQALHSHRLTFPHPITGEWMEFCSPLPPDMQAVLCTDNTASPLPNSF